MAGHQLRLLLWKDYLIRRRKWVTLAGVVWAVAVMLSLYIVRINVDNQDFPSCQFPARALPSAGLLTFLQSFVCSVNNECLPMDQYQEIPVYENSKLTQLQRQFSPLIYNETVLDVAGSVPDALKLLSTLADIADQPTFIKITKKGLKLQDLFRKPNKLKQYLISNMGLTEEIARTVIAAELNFQGIIKKGLDECNPNSVSSILKITNKEYADSFADKLCSLSNERIFNTVMNLITEVDFQKYSDMIGEMYYKLSGDKTVLELGDMVTAVLHIIKTENFLPSELVTVFTNNDADLNYFNMTVFQKLMDLYEPTFGDTEIYKILKDFTDALVMGTQYLNKLTKAPKLDTEDAELENYQRNDSLSNNKDIISPSKMFNNAMKVFEDTMEKESSISIFNIIAQLTKIIHKFLPKQMKHDLLYYSTLLAKLMEGTIKVIDVNTHVQEMAYNVSLRNPEGVKILVGLPVSVIGKGFEALADAERTQILTAKVNFPGQMFCDGNRIAGFFKISKDEADSLKSKLCTNAWKNYVTDLIRSFRIYDVKDNINTMASIVIQDTIGKNINEHLYSIDKIFDVLKNFTQTLTEMNTDDKPSLNWSNVLNVANDSEFMNVLRQKGQLGKQMLITVHGALAKEVVKQNPLLEYKISPTLIDITTMLAAINKQLETPPVELIKRLKDLYPTVIQTMLRTMLNENKTYKSLSTPSEDIVCIGVDNASIYLEFPPDIDQKALLAALCDTALEIEKGLQRDSLVAKALHKIKNSTHSIFDSVDWTKLINNIKNLYIKLEVDYPYLFEYKSYGMDGDTQKLVRQMLKEAQQIWFSWSNLERSVHLSVKLLLRFLDLVDRDIFNVTDQTWLKVKQMLASTTGPLEILSDIVADLTVLSSNESSLINLPHTTAVALSAILPNIPNLIVDFTDVIVSGDTDITPIQSLMNTEPPWPCSNTSISEYIHLSTNSSQAVMAMETLMCMDEGLQQEWMQYLNEKYLNYSAPHIFLKFSSALDSLIEDIIAVRNVLNDVVNDIKSDSQQLTVVTAWKYAEDVFKDADKNTTFRDFFTKVDAVLNAVNTSTSVSNLSVNIIWEQYTKCVNGSVIERQCKLLGRAAWKYTFEFLSVMLENVATDLTTYFREISEPNSNVLQLLGFTKNTGLYILYDKFPEFVGALINSYWDYGFMSQIRRASLAEFWDCNAVVDALLPLPGSGIDSAIIQKVRPFVCPSILHWISLPRGDNILLDVISKPQYLFYTLPVQNLTSDFKEAFNKSTELTNILIEIVQKNKTLITENDVKLNTIEGKLKDTVDTILTYTINKTDAAFRLFNEINIKQFYGTIYLTRVVAINNKLLDAFDNLNITAIGNDLSEDEMKRLETDVSFIKRTFKRRPSDIVALHFDVITDILWKNDENYKLSEAIDTMCNDLKNNDTNKDILNDDRRIKQQICNKNYQRIYGAVENVLTDDYDNIRNSLLNLVNLLRKENSDDISSIFDFLKKKRQLMKSLKYSIKYAYDLSLPIYLKYLQNNLQNYNVILSFLSGEDWWRDLRVLYNGTYANNFFDAVEKSLDIAEDILSKPDRIHLVRLLREININNTEALCQSNITISDYIPDGTGAITKLKQQICSADKTDIFKEIPALVFASQGYNDALKMSKEVNYTALDNVIVKTESKLELLRDGPKTPQRPSWVDDEKLSRLRNVALGLLSKEYITKASFGLLSNFIDASTLFLNTSHCVLCSEFTTWFKQVNLQLFKKQEYDNLLCHLPSMTLEDIYHTLKNDFHWDMAIRELISSRNYTKYEMNKAITELLEQMKLHLLEDISSNSTKLAQCLMRNVTDNDLGKATLFITVLSHTAKLVRSQLPHLHEVYGMTEVPYFKRLFSEVAHKLDVNVPLKNFLVQNNKLSEELGEIVNGDVARAIGEAKVNLRMIKMNTRTSLKQYIYLRNMKWKDICKSYDCDNISTIINENINRTLVQKELPVLQSQEFWRFTFISNIIEHVEEFISHVARLVGLASKIDISGVVEGRLTSVLDLMMQVLMDDTLTGIVYSIHGMLKEMTPLLQGTTLEHDLKAITRGLTVLQQIKKYLIEKSDLKVDVEKVFLNPERMETSLSKLGFNNTNFWSVAAPRIHSGHMQLKPVLTSKQSDNHIASFVCQPEQMSKVVFPTDLDVVTADDVYGAVIEQFCAVTDEQAKQIVPVLLENLNYSHIFEKVSDAFLSQLYMASNLSQTEGATVLNNLPQMAALLPTIQNSVGDLSETLVSEPLFQTLKEFDSVGGLLSSSEFMSSAGNMLCGTPFQSDLSRFYRVISQTKDMSKSPDQAHLDALPTDFCRSLYKDILNIDGGKIVWSFVKPLIMGKILYTPNTPTVQKIIEKANGTFSHVVKLTELVHSFARAFSSVDKLSIHREGLGVMKRLISSPAFEDVRSALVGDHKLPEFDVDGLFDEFGDLKGVGSLLSKASDLLRCINLNRFSPARDEFDLTHKALELSFVDEFSAGLVFLNSEEQGGALTNMKYKIRMDIENAPTTKRLKNYLWIPGPESSFIENMRYFRGFVQIQDMIDKAIIDLSHTRQKRDLTEDPKWAVYTQQTPYPCYRKDFFQTSLYESQSLLVAFFFSLLYTVASAVRFIVADKESGNTMLMSVMGVNMSYHTLSWFLVSFTELTVTCVGIAAVLWLGGVLPHTAPSLVFALLIIFGFSVLCFCYLMSKLFASASFAAVSTAIVYMVTFMPIVMVLSLESALSSSYKMLICLSMSSAVSYAFLYITRYEAMGMGAQWSDVWSSPVEEGANMTIGLAAAMMLIDAFLYLLIGWLIDRYFGLTTLRSNITNCVTSGEKAGVSIVNITKVYGERSRRPKVALDNVSMELQKGQITTLLGHNGAGKTTLTKILMGMLKPTKGNIIIRSEHESGTTLGVCPQHDVLFEYMSAREHIALYAQLKSGLPLEQVRDEVEKLLEVLSLGAAGALPALRLSGGTRRRLCVALAFVARPHLVSLDEPTAGVDPAARRDIWSMIIKLKEDRTILLTTHHLDEAELLSDQIVIMHKGQIHTTGSPIEIKRTLGTGYKLAVTYPNPSARTDSQEWPDEEFNFEEKTKELLTVVKEVVTNASLVDVNGTEVEIMVPFYDTHGLNNDFLQLCTALENGQTALGFKNFTLECSSLEQVFFNICQQADATNQGIEYEDTPSKSASSSSIRNESAPLVDSEGPLKGTTYQQFLALMYARYLHYTRNMWLLFLLVVLPSLFIIIAMAFSTIRPPADNEIPLLLSPSLYENTTEFLVPNSYLMNENVDPTFAGQVMKILELNKRTRNWTQQDSPTCKCTETRQECDYTNVTNTRPDMILLPDVDTLNHWLVSSQDYYIEKRYGGFTSTLHNNMSALVVWYNNKGHHALPSYLNALNTAILRTVAGDTASITTYSHPLKISKEQISKDTVYQHVADAGISALLLVAYSLVSAGAAIYLVSARTSQEKRLQLLCGVSPALYWGVALAWDMLIIVINMLVSVMVMEAFHFPVFVARDNLPAICVLLLLFGFACSSLIHVAEKLFSEPSMANMILFCGNTFMGLVGIAILLILDVISESEKTDHARWVLHKIFMLSPQFALGDGLLEIAKNTIQAQVLGRFGMDTYRSPFNSDLVAYHYAYLIVVGTALLLFNLAIEYNYFDGILSFFRFRSDATWEERDSGELEAVEVCAERKRVQTAAVTAPPLLRLRTIGNINAGFVDSEDSPKKKSNKRVSPASDVAACLDLTKTYPTLSGTKVAVSRLTLGIPYGQCTALLGQNGAGKSTTFSMLTGQTRPTAGQIYLNDRPASGGELCRGLISYCPQSDAIDPLMTVRETLVFYCKLRGIAEWEEVTRRALDTFELRKYEHVRTRALSGGNRRKLCTAMAFAARAPLVLLDEPTSGMDPVSRACVWRGVAAAARGVLLSTHALQDARRLAARVALMRNGRLVALADLDDCLNRFGGGYVVQVRVAARALWPRVRRRAPHASLRALHHGALHFLLPHIATGLCEAFTNAPEKDGGERGVRSKPAIGLTEWHRAISSLKWTAWPKGAANGTNLDLGSRRTYPVDKKEVVTRLSDIFRLMAELQGTCDIDDYTINQSSLDQMFLSFTDKADVDFETVDVEPLPSPDMLRRNSEEIDTVTSL
ncbi:LOW QUALITY PROTEIN: lipid droplet defective [Aphomia sociella]